MGNANLEYKAILEDRQKKIQRKIKELKRKEKGIFGSRNSITIKGLEKEAEEIKKLIENYEDRVILSDTAESGLAGLNNMRSKRETKKSEYQDKINIVTNAFKAIKRDRKKVKVLTIGIKSIN